MRTLSTEFYVDESKARGYIIVAAVVPSGQATHLRKALRDLRMKGQRRIHFVEESPRRRRELLSAMVALDCQARVYRIRDAPELAARGACLRSMIDDMALLNARRLVLERDESMATHDKRVIRSALIAHDMQGQLSYSHEAAASEPLLWIAGDWRRRASPMVASVANLTR